MVRALEARLPILLIMRTLLMIVVATLLTGCQSTPTAKQPWQILSETFGDEDVVFVAMKSPGEPLMVHDVMRAAERFPPCSTFKIWNTLIGLETGAIPDTSFALKWDQQRDPAQDFWPESWKRDHDLTSAFRNSVFWFYQEIARRVGMERMQAYINMLQFGNRDLTGGIDHFWLESSLRISPSEQVHLIEKLVTGDVPFSAQHIAIVTELMKQNDEGGFTLYGKTGLGHLPDSDGYEGWFIGWAEVSGRKSPFAIYMRSNSYDDILHARKANALRGLRALKLIP